MPSKHISPMANTSNPLFNCPHALKANFTKCQHLKPPFQLPPCPQNAIHQPVPTPQTPFSTPPMPSKHMSPSANTSRPLFLAHANCTPFFSPKHLDFVTEKKFFCHLENTVFQTLPKNAFFISFAHFLLFLGGSNNDSLVQNQRVYRSFSPKKILLANWKNTNFWIIWKTIKDGRCSHIRYMFT